MRRSPAATLGLALGLALARPVAAAPRARPGGALRLSLPGAPADLDPARAGSAPELILARALHATLYLPASGGGVRPGLAAGLPEVSPDGRTWRITLRPGLTFQDGSPLTAADVAESLARLLRPSTRSVHGWIAAPIEGAAAVRAGVARDLAGAQALSANQLLLRLAWPAADLLLALAAAPAAVVREGPDGLLGAGPFRLERRAAEGLRLVPFAGHHRGRPWLEAVAASWPGPVADARRPSRGEADLALRPEPAGPAAGLEVPPTAVVLALVGERLGPAAAAVREAVSGVVRSGLWRLLRGAGPRPSVAPPATPPATPTSTPTSPSTPVGVSGLPPRLALLAPRSLRALADRLQVKLFDRGVQVGVELVEEEALAARLAARRHDLLLVAVPLATAAPALQLAQVAELAAGAGAAAAVAEELALLAPAAAVGAAAQVEERLGAVALAELPLRLSAVPAVQGLPPAGGELDLGDLWLLPALPPAP